MLIPYIRQSRSSERTISIDEQRRDIRTWAKAAGVTLAKEIVEQNVSGSRPWRERGLGQAIAACERGEAAGIIVAWQDRLSRENGLATAEVWDALERAELRLVCAAEGLDTDSGDHELTFSIKAAIARDQWKRHKANWERTRRSAIERGVHVGPAPIGYRRTESGQLEPDEHADAIRAAFELRAEGGSWTQVGRLLNERGVPTGRMQYFESHGPEAFEKWRGRRFNESDRRWRLMSAKKLLSNTAYLGVVRSGEFTRLDAHEALVSRRVFDRVEARRQTRTRHSEIEPGLLTGIVVCATCSNRMQQDYVVKKGGPRIRIYRCRNNGVCQKRATITHSRVEPHVEAQALAFLGAIDFRSAERHGPSAELEAAASEAESELRAFVELVSAKTPGFAEGLARRQAALAEARAAADTATETDEAWTYLSAGATAETYGRMTLADKRRVVGACVNRVTVRWGAGPVEERVTIEFKPHPVAAVERPAFVTESVTL